MPHSLKTSFSQDKEETEDGEPSPQVSPITSPVSNTCSLPDYEELEESYSQPQPQDKRKRPTPSQDSELNHKRRREVPPDDEDQTELERFIESLTMSGAADLVCPITGMIMTDPVVAEVVKAPTTPLGSLIDVCC